MKLEIRNGVFETNSSSTHALAVGCNHTHIPKKVVFGTGEYGWEFEDYSMCDTADAASYLYTALLSAYGWKKDESELHKYTDKIEEILKEAGVEEVVWDTPIKGEYGYPCYVDHGYELEGFINTLLEDKNLLLGWLFDDYSGFITGNDNSDSCDYVNDWEEKMKRNPDIAMTYYKGN